VASLNHDRSPSPSPRPPDASHLTVPGSAAAKRTSAGKLGITVAAPSFLRAQTTPATGVVMPGSSAVHAQQPVSPLGIAVGPPGALPASARLAGAASADDMRIFPAAEENALKARGSSLAKIKVEDDQTHSTAAGTLLAGALWAQQKASEESSATAAAPPPVETAAEVVPSVPVEEDHDLTSTTAAKVCYPSSIAAQRTVLIRVMSCDGWCYYVLYP